MMELKTKYKNMKRFTLKSDKEEPRILNQESTTEEAAPSPQKKVRIIGVTGLSESTPVILSKKPNSESKSYYSGLDELDPTWDNSDDDVSFSKSSQDLNLIFFSFPQYPQVSVNSTIDKQDEAIRKENLLLKNSVLRKKERLLELQIALAERNLRRHPI
jgi:hypothetical protein